MNGPRLPGLVRVAIADDHPIILRAVSEALTTVQGYRIDVHATSGSQLLAQLATTACDLVITDLTMRVAQADEDGLRLVQRLVRLYPHVPVVVFTMVTNGALLNQICRAGAAGIAGKDERITALLAVCEQALAFTATALSPGVRERVEQAHRAAGSPQRASPLSARELEVLRLFALGLSVSDIARRLNRSVTTVATQKASAMRKLCVSNNVDLVRFATENGIV